MSKQLPVPAPADDGSGHKAGRRGVVRYLQNETAPGAARKVLGNALRLSRECAGLSLGEAAGRLGVSSSKVSRIESGMHSPKERELPEFFRTYGITTAEEQANLRELAAAAHRPTWWQPWSAVTPKYLQAVVSFEDMASRVRSFEPTYLHGLLQTPEYARALIERGRGPASTHDELVRFRTKRQEQFTASDKKLLCVVDEATLGRAVGSAAIMRGQLQHLIDLTHSPRIQLRLAPLYDFDVHVELGPTTIFDFAGRLLPTIVFTEGYDGGLVIEDEAMVDRRVKAFDALAARSLDSHAMRRRLQHLLVRYK
ncbi:helix-turn-helix domain-containing protein [Streptomyces bauhiniae]|uniref:helix-turn-helix domain-containing protein n=1 Tax=Streptomyces bauhiniae TaxID=2340725 RepID=UPI001FCA50CB|nr:helix-turn-helix transcriptional regulator [Streptomyces bauhiniae]